MKTDVTIIGAGPAGATCALRLADSGLDVTLLDKDDFPRDKICGDALSGKVVSVLKYTRPELVDRLYELPSKTPSWGIRFVAPCGEHLDVPFKNPHTNPQAQAPGFISKRWDFDDFLVKEAAKHPHIHLHTGRGVQKVERRSDGFSVENGVQTFESRMIVGADGAHSIVKRSLSPIHPPKKHHAAGLRAYYKGVTGFREGNFIELHFIHDLLPGYFWIFPLPNGWANVGLGLRSDIVSKRKVNIKKLFHQIIETHPGFQSRFQQAEMQGPLRGFGLPLGSTWREIVGDGWILTGDAAGLIDPFSGEGIGNAMLSGKIAAEQMMAAFEAQDFSQVFLQPYVQKLRKKIGKELQVSYQMQRLAVYPKLFDFVVKKANRNPSLQTMMTMMFDNIDLRKELAKPRFYWNLLFGGSTEPPQKVHA
ncbi:MAG: NAD(P)/FAD-dependent oxidoreductase [Bacteroidota bacterium]